MKNELNHSKIDCLDSNEHRRNRKQGSNSQLPVKVPSTWWGLLPPHLAASSAFASFRLYLIPWWYRSLSCFQAKTMKHALAEHQPSSEKEETDGSSRVARWLRAVRFTLVHFRTETTRRATFRAKSRPTHIIFNLSRAPSTDHIYY
jgi:hypothetical protein